MALLTFTALIDPADTIFHMKVPAFALAIAVWIYRRGVFGSTITPALWVATLGIGVVIPLTWTLLGIVHSSVHSGENSFTLIKSFLFLLVLPVLISEDIDLVSLLERVCVLVALLTLIIAAISYLSPVIFLGIYEFTIEKQNAIITSARDSFGVGLGQFYYKTSPLMIFPFGYYCGRLFQECGKTWTSLFMTLIYAAALLSSGARANVLAALFVFGVLALWRIRTSGGVTVALLVGTVFAALLMATILPKFANPTEESNVIKLGHIQSYVQEFEDHPSTLIWGEGANTAFFSKGFNDWTTVTEVTYLELIRVFGIPVTLFFTVGLLWIAYRLISDGRLVLLLSYSAYLVICTSNPLLISSTGFLAICAVWKEVARKSGIGSAFHLPQAATRGTSLLKEQVHA